MRSRAGFAVLGAALAVAAEAQAQEYCVACTEPNAIYRCTISGARPGLSQSLQVACITALAKEGRHASCSVKRGATVFECDGPVKIVTVGADTGSGAPEPQVITQPKAEPAPTDPKAPPATVAEAIKRAQTQSNEDMRKAGKATATFFERTFTCLGSLFTKCGQD